MFETILSLAAVLVIILVVASIVPLMRKIERENNIAAGYWFGGRHARQPRAYRAHRAIRGEQARQARAAR